MDRNGFAASSQEAPAGGRSARLQGPVVDRTAEFEALLGPLLKRAYGFAWNMTRNDSDAEDLLQEAALNAYRGFASFTPGTNFKAWFYRILRNCYLMQYRRESRRPKAVDLESAGALYLYQRAAEEGLLREEADAAGEILDRMEVEDIAEALSRLPDDYRAACTLYFLEDLDYAEIASALGCPIGTVRSRLHRGRRMLQKALWKTALENGVVRAREGVA